MITEKPILITFLQWCSQGLPTLAHPEDQNEEENLRKNERNYKKRGKIEEILLVLPTWEWEAG